MLLIWTPTDSNTSHNLYFQRLQLKSTFKLMSDIVWHAASSNTAALNSSNTDVVTTVIYFNETGDLGKHGLSSNMLQIKRNEDLFGAYLA